MNPSLIIGLVLLVASASKGAANPIINYADCIGNIEARLSEASKQDDVSALQAKNQDDYDRLMTQLSPAYQREFEGRFKSARQIRSMRMDIVEMTGGRGPQAEVLNESEVGCVELRQWIASSGFLAP